jgi:two-component sensor histidine kinase
MVFTSWNKISSIGIQPHYNEVQKKRIMLTNQYCMVALIIFLFSGINNFILGDTFSAVIIELYTFVCLFGFWLNKKGHHAVASSFILISISIAIFYFDSYSGIASGTFLYYFPLALAIAFIFESSEKKAIALHFTIPIILLTINVLTRHQLFKSDFITDEDRYNMFMFNLPFSITSIGLFVFLTLSNNKRQHDLYEQQINERKETEKIIKQALIEKEILLAEIHHRVKNNLSIIASLFNLQISTIENEDAKDILLESKNRVKSMALIHDKLYKNDSFNDVDFGAYICELITEIKYSYPTLSANVDIQTNISNAKLNVNNAIPCGLILNELLTNCYKHAFKGRDKGTIMIEFSSLGKDVTLKVKDDGTGLKPDYENSESLGMVVIQSLSEQLGGKHLFTVDNGTCFELTFAQEPI